MIRLRNLSVWTAMAMILLFVSSFGQSIVQVTRLPSTTYWDQAYGLAADSTRLFLSSGTSTAVYNRGFIYTASLSSVFTDSISTGLSTSQGLAWDGTHFWYVRGSASSLRIYKITTAGAIVDSILPPTTWYFGGACWDGSGLWVSNYYPNNLAKLYKYNVSTKTIVDSIPTYGLQPQGIAWDGQYLFYVMDNNDGDVEKIYQVNMGTRDTVKSWYLPEGPTSNMSPRGLAWDGHFLWMIAEPVGGSSGRSLYKYDLGGAGTPDIQLSATVLDFGIVRMGSVYRRTVNIQNVGTAPLVLPMQSFPLGNWYTSLVTPDTLAPNETMIWELFNAPLPIFGPDSAYFQLQSNDPDEPTVSVKVKNFTIYPSAFIQADTAYNFGARRVGSSNPWGFTLKNRGAQQLSVSSIVSNNGAFVLDSVQFPVLLDSLQTKSFRVWFKPTSATSYNGTLTITSNAYNGPTNTIRLQGTGDATSIPIGQPFWTFTVPNNPRTSSNSKLVKAVRAISDITGDGKPDVVVSSENYWTMALNGNASVANDSLWAFNTYIGNYSAGSIGSTGDYSHQKALSVADLNQDSYLDVIIGTGGGNEHVYALNGRNGQILWQFGTDHPDSFSLGDITGVDATVDITGDGVPEVLAAAAATESGGVGGRRSVYQFNGANGSIRWVSPLLGFTHAVAAINDVTGDGVPDVVGCVGEPSYKASAFSGTNGALLWDFAVPSASGGAKEVLSWPVTPGNNDVVVSAFWGPIYRVDGESGTQMWSCPTGGSGVMQLVRLRDVTGDGVDEVLAPLLGGGIYCVNGANGSIVWSLPTGNTMGAASVRDLNGDGHDEVAIAVQNQGTMIVKGQDGSQVALYPTGTSQTREVAAVPDMDGNISFEIIMGGQQGNVALLSGGSGLSSVGEHGEFPDAFSVGQNYPNPFNPTTTIEVSMPVQGNLNLKIFDVLGREVRSFVYDKAPAGVHKILWDGRNQHGTPVSSGVYFYHARVGESAAVQRMLMLK